MLIEAMDQALLHGRNPMRSSPHCATLSKITFGVLCRYYIRLAREGILVGITKDEAELIVNQFQNCEIIDNPMQGGQKTVFPCMINNRKYALKFLKLENEMDDHDLIDESPFDSDYERAVRETNALNDFNSPYIVKLGPIKLTKTKYNNSKFVFYTEEWIEGRNLQGIKLSIHDCVQLGIDIGYAIGLLDQKGKIHRDIKPGNIMQRFSDGHFVLLDLGLLYDKLDKSLTQVGFVPGTLLYLSPEQMDCMRKKELDFRSDLFSLGIVMYQCSTGLYPFGNINQIGPDEILRNILSMKETPAHVIDSNIPEKLSKVISQLLSKRPNGRYRKIDFLIDDLKPLL